MPTVNPNDAARNTVYGLINLRQITNKNGTLNIKPTHRHKLEMLAKKFNMTMTPQRVKDNITPLRVKTYNTPPRVKATNTPTYSIDTTSPYHVNIQKKIHQKVTRKNTPIPQHTEIPQKSIPMSKIIQRSNRLNHTRVQRGNNPLHISQAAVYQ